MKKIMQRWRGWTSEEAVLDLWSRATGTPIEVLREGISRRDFMRGLGSVAGMAVAPRGLAATDDTGDTGDYGPRAPWVPSDSDIRWTRTDNPDDRTAPGLRGYVYIPPNEVKEEDIVAGGGFTVKGYREVLKGWREKDLVGSLMGQRATIVHGDPKSGRGLGLETFKAKDTRNFQGKIKLPITWSLMYDELKKRRLETI